MRFPGFRLVEQTEQKLRHIRDCLKKKRVTVIGVRSNIENLLPQGKSKKTNSPGKRKTKKSNFGMFDIDRFPSAIHEVKRDYNSESFFQSTPIDHNSSRKFYKISRGKIVPFDPAI